MESILLVIHVIVALVIIGLIMLQQGKGAEMGASFGSGSSQTVFGATGSGNFFSRMTAIMVAVFFTTSFVLAMIAQNRVDVVDAPIPGLEEVIETDEVEASDGIPSLEEDSSADDAAIPTLDSENSDTEQAEMPAQEADAEEAQQ